MENLYIHEFGELKLDKEGILYHNNLPFVHESTGKYFKKHIVKENNQYFVKVGENKAPIQVEDVFLFIENIDIDENNSSIKLYLSNDTEITIDQYTELILDNDYLYYQDKNLKAKFTRKTYNMLMNYLSEPYENYLLKIGSLQIKIIQK